MGDATSPSKEPDTIPSVKYPSSVNGRKRALSAVWLGNRRISSGASVLQAWFPTRTSVSVKSVWEITAITMRSAREAFRSRQVAPHPFVGALPATFKVQIRGCVSRARSLWAENALRPHNAPHRPKGGQPFVTYQQSCADVARILSR